MSLIYTTSAGLEVHFEPEEEYDGLEELLPDNTTAQIRGLHKRIENGNAVVFCARVWAEKLGVKLSDDQYLGGCIYGSYKQFTGEVEGYFHDLAVEALASAEAKLKELCSCE